MGNEDFGECSRKREDEEYSKPFKKARYVWQLKGKYHLKETNPETTSVVNDDKNTVDEQDDEDMCNRKCIDNFLERTQAILDSEDEEISRNIEKSISNEIPITLVSPRQENCDYYLKKWQARQIARSYIDNTINSVLETWVSAPFDAEDFVDHCEDDGKIEDEGILMAIQAHGLQSNSSSVKGPSFVKPHELAENTLDEIDNARSRFLRKFMVEPSTTMSCSSSFEETKFDVTYPANLLNAAILVAIEKKGLSSQNQTT